jgi:hypothetical protein
LIAILASVAVVTEATFEAFGDITLLTIAILIKCSLLTNLACRACISTRHASGKFIGAFFAFIAIVTQVMVDFAFFAL